MYLRETFEVIVKEHEINPTNYDEVINAKLEYMYTNEVWELIVALEGIKNHKVQVVLQEEKGLKGYSKKLGFNYEETFSSVAMLKSIRILLSIITYLNYEIWKMDIKIAFLNGYLDEIIYMMQPNGFIEKVRAFDFDQNKDEPWPLSLVKIWLSTKFQVKDLGEYVMWNSKKGLLSFMHGILFFQDQCPKTLVEKECMQAIPYASCDVIVQNIPSMENLANCFNKTLIGRVFVSHRDNIGFK
ncbi:hypothetical protein AAG906_004796 [Vitis piasezkii]